jgi:peptidoglycan hydrolase-like protein with peptidoglycan-binding domain
VRDGIKIEGNYITPAIYSSRNTCSIVIEQSLANSCFVSDMSTGYSGSLGFPLPNSWEYDQIQEVTIDAVLSTEFDVDRDIMRKELQVIQKI